MVVPSAAEMSNKRRAEGPVDFVGERYLVTLT